MTKQYIIFLTEGEIKALLNLSRVAMNNFKDDDYVENLAINGGKTALEKLVSKSVELNHDAKRE